MSCDDGYLQGPVCQQKCKEDSRCVRCRLCTNCHNNGCGVEEQCSYGYKPGPHCETRCTDESRCTKCRICVNCGQSWCGLEEHKVNYAVLQSVCDKCEHEELAEDSKCTVCGSRCDRCRVVKKKSAVIPCEDTCGYRQRCFKATTLNYVPTS